VSTRFTGKKDEMAKIFGVALAVVTAVSLGAVAWERTAQQQMPRDRTANEQRSRDRAAFERKVAALERTTAEQPANASAQHLVGSVYFEKTRDQSLTADERRGYITRGLAAEDRALAADPDYVEALVYKNLLLRTQATLEIDAGLQAALLRDADALRNRALALQRARPASYTIPEGTVVTPGPPPPPPPPPPGGVDGPIDWVYADTHVTAAGKMPVKTRDVRPIYAPMVIASGYKGEVVLEAKIDMAGKVSQVRVIKSQPMLTQAAIDAVRQWEFDPTSVGAAGSVITVTAIFRPPTR
jgi:TonB family protein